MAQSLKPELTMPTHNISPTNLKSAPANSTASLTEKDLAPAPWHLTGEGYVVAVWMPASGTTSKWRWPRGHIELLVFASYDHSDVGPYHELLHIPPLSRGIIKGYPSIDKIYVSTLASVINGQKNWGIPKQLAQFDYQIDQQKTTGQAQQDIVRIQLNTPEHQPIAHIEFQIQRRQFPVSTAMVPRRLRTLVQDWQGKRFYTAPEASGHACVASVKNWTFDPVHFPDLSQAKVLSAFKISDFKMVFPVPHQVKNS